ncbi:MAG TPA: AAA family ATPase [Acidimicrobiales bacterium]|nr:AAA family ATPase [Acidimicrobiales bacterium]
MITSRILVASRGEGLTQAVRRAMGPGGQVVACPRVADLGRLVDEAGPFDVVVAGPALDNHAGMTRLASLRRSHPELAIVLALPDPPRAGLADLVRTGAVELVSYPARDLAPLASAMGAAHRHAVAMSERRLPKTSEPAVPSLSPVGTVLTVASSTGGCGKTFYATNLAYHLARVTGQKVCLVDLDLQFGEVSTALRLKPQYSVADALAGTADEDELYDHVDGYLTPHPAGFQVLTAPRDPSEADQISPPEVTRIIRVLRRRFDYVVVDTPAQLSETVLAAFDQSSRLLCLCTFDLPSVRNTTVFLATLGKLKIPTDEISVILNKVEAGIGLEVAEVDEVFEHRIESNLPFAREVSRSINQGQPVLAMCPNTDISRQLVASMSRWTPGGGQVELGTAAPAAASRIRRLFHRERPAHQEVAIA